MKKIIWLLLTLVLAASLLCIPASAKDELTDEVPCIAATGDEIPVQNLGTIYGRKIVLDCTIEELKKMDSTVSGHPILHEWDWEYTASPDRSMSYTTAEFSHKLPNGLECIVTVTGKYDNVNSEITGATCSYTLDDYDQAQPVFQFSPSGNALYVTFCNDYTTHLTVIESTVYEISPDGIITPQ